MKLLKLVFLLTWLYVPQVMAHSGHGDHTAILASGEMHPFISLEHVLLTLAVAAVLFLLGKKAN